MSRSKSNTLSSNSDLNRSGIEASIISGEALYRDILNKVHKNNFDEMYTFLLKNIDRLEIFGDTKEKQIINYFAFKREVIIQLYR